MRTITASQRQALEDLSAEGLLKQLPIQTAEKDIHITELLKGLSELEVHHNHFSGINPQNGERTRHDTGIQLVFAGGTCLSKAHGLINRMSEDIDIKVILTPTEQPLRRGRGNRARLGALHSEISRLMESLNFPLISHEDGRENPRTRDSRRYHVVDAGYNSAYQQLPSLRPELKLELIERSTLLPHEQQEFGYLHEALAGIKPSATVSIPCVSVAETVAEKVVSLLRRCALVWGGHQTMGVVDPTLVRHIYDVACIAEKSPDSLDAARKIFSQVIQNDLRDFAGKNPDFDKDPSGVLKRTLEEARINEELQQRYSQLLMPLVYDADPPTFEQSFKKFEEVAQNLLSAC